MSTLSPHLIRIFIAVPVLGLLIGCGSNNEGKILGKWKILQSKGFDENTKNKMDMMKAFTFVEFKPDSTMSMGIHFADSNKENPFVQMLNKAFDFSLKYKLLSGNRVEFYDAPPGKDLFKGKERAQATITIDGNKMKWVDSDGTAMTLEKIQ